MFRRCLRGYLPDKVPAALIEGRGREDAIVAALATGRCYGVSSGRRSHILVSDHILGAVTEAASPWSRARINFDRKFV